MKNNFNNKAHKSVGTLKSAALLSAPLFLVNDYMGVSNNRIVFLPGSGSDQFGAAGDVEQITKIGSYTICLVVIQSLCW